MKRKLDKAYYALRWRILERDKFSCQYCGQFAPNVMLQVDHIIPAADGGRTDESNLITACSACNQGRQAFKIIMEFRKPKPFILSSKLSPETIETKQSEATRLLREGCPEGITLTEFAQKLNITREYAAVLLNRMKRRNIIEHQPPKKWRIRGNLLENTLSKIHQG